MRFAMVATWCVIVCLAGLGLADVLAGCGAGGIGPDFDRYYEQDDAPPAPVAAPTIGDTPTPGPTDPVPTPEPAPKLLTFDQVMGYQLRWQQKQEEYLKQGGWRMDEANPGQFFLWHIEHKGIRYAMGRDDAIYVQARIEKDAAQAALERQIEQNTGVQ